MSELELLGDARDPKATLAALRQLLKTQGVRQAVLTVRPSSGALWRHGLALNTPSGWALIDEAFVSGNGGERAVALNKALGLLERHLMRLRWTRANNGALTNDLATALGHGWLEHSELLAVVRERGDEFAVVFEPAADRLVIRETPKARAAKSDTRQMGLWDGLPGLELP